MISLTHLFSIKTGTATWDVRAAFFPETVIMTGTLYVHVSIVFRTFGNTGVVTAICMFQRDGTRIKYRMSMCLNGDHLKNSTYKWMKSPVPCSYEMAHRVSVRLEAYKFKNEERTHSSFLATRHEDYRRSFRADFSQRTFRFRLLT